MEIQISFVCWKILDLYLMKKQIWFFVAILFSLKKNVFSSLLQISKLKKNQILNLDMLINY